ncbi:MAG: hypothetical protein DMG73_18180 [Acidobacteria bacterium]|nr:MAG: hypothetical protein DMG73_18180 [Acidobacteriota bacterium]PYX64176.1 MAG: hypothetical protein DMG74_14040 [Acidobacteriota bacterium]
MAKEQKSRTPLPVGKYRQVDIASIQRGRRGKHHDLVLGIVQELATLEPGAALEIPLASVGGVGLANLRSAVHRATTSKGMEIETVADDGKFYVWKRAASE